MRVPMPGKAVWGALLAPAVLFLSGCGGGGGDGGGGGGAQWVMSGGLVDGYVCAPAAAASHKASLTLLSATPDPTAWTQVEGCRVAIVDTSLSATTDALGRYEILQVPPGHYTLTASRQGYDSRSVAIEVVEGRYTHGAVGPTADPHVRVFAQSTGGDAPAGYEVWVGDSTGWDLYNVHETDFVRVGQAAAPGSFPVGNHRYVCIATLTTVVLDAVSLPSGRFLNRDTDNVSGGNVEPFPTGIEYVYGPPDAAVAMLGVLPPRHSTGLYNGCLLIELK
jgi:hypothetical protein